MLSKWHLRCAARPSLFQWVRWRQNLKHAYCFLIYSESIPIGIFCLHLQTKKCPIKWQFFKMCVVYTILVNDVLYCLALSWIDFHTLFSRSYCGSKYLVLLSLVYHIQGHRTIYLDSFLKASKSRLWRFFFSL